MSADVYIENDDFIKISKLKIKLTGKREKGFKNPWAITYKEETYVSMNFQENSVLRGVGVFVKLDIEGKYCLAAIKKENVDEMNWSSSKRPRQDHSIALNPLSSIADVLNFQTEKAVSRWKDQSGVKHHILISNTSVKDGLRNSMGHVLRRDNFNRLLACNYKSSEIAKFSLEKVIEIVSSKNKSK
ncbi:MAG: hypothetical protein AAGK97_08090 [Bacteroidota bacterium]